MISGIGFNIGIERQLTCQDHTIAAGVNLPKLNLYPI